MAYDGNGVFNRLYNWEADAAAGINILAERMDAEMNGFATGLSQVLTRDGQAGMLANLDMGNFRITGLGDATAENDAISRKVGDARYLKVAGGTMEGPLKIKQGATGALTDPMLQFLDAAGVPRWALVRLLTTGNLDLYRASSAGVNQGLVLSFFEDGQAAFYNTVNIDSPTGGATLMLKDGTGVARWSFTRDSASGDLLIGRYSAGTGAWQNAPLRLYQDTGAARVEGQFYANQGLFTDLGLEFGGANVSTQTITKSRLIMFGSGNNMAVLQLLNPSGQSLVEHRVALNGDVCRIQYVRPNINRTDIDMNPGTGFYMNMGNQTGSANIVGVWDGVSKHRVSVVSSERRMKRDLKDVVGGLAYVLKMKPLKYRPASPDEPDREWPGFTVDDMEEIGLEELVIHNGPDNPKGLAYDRVPVYLVSAVQELTRRLVAIEEKLAQGV